jgi:hypothetical protein
VRGLPALCAILARRNLAARVASLVLLPLAGAVEYLRGWDLETTA